MSEPQTITVSNNTNVPRTFVIQADLGLSTFADVMPEFIFELVCDRKGRKKTGNERGARGGGVLLAF